MVFRETFLKWSFKNITYPQCMLVALGVQHAMRLRYIVIYSVPGLTVYFHIVS